MTKCPKKERKSSSTIRSDSDDFPGAVTSVNQLVSDQGGMVHQTTGKLTHSRIWSAAVLVDHYAMVWDLCPSYSGQFQFQLVD